MEWSSLIELDLILNFCLLQFFMFFRVFHHSGQRWKWRFCFCLSLPRKYLQKFRLQLQYLRSVRISRVRTEPVEKRRYRQEPFFILHHANNIIPCPAHSPFQNHKLPKGKDCENSYSNFLIEIIRRWGPFWKIVKVIRSCQPLWFPALNTLLLLATGKLWILKDFSRFSDQSFDALYALSRRIKFSILDFFLDFPSWNSAIHVLTLGLLFENFNFYFVLHKTTIRCSW